MQMLMFIFLKIFGRIREIVEENREVCIHPSVRHKPFCSQVDITKVSFSFLFNLHWINFHLVQVHVIKRDEQDLRVEGNVLSFYKINCYLPITIVEECLERMKL